MFEVGYDFHYSCRLDLEFMLTPKLKFCELVFEQVCNYELVVIAWMHKLNEKKIV